MFQKHNHFEGRLNCIYKNSVTTQVSLTIVRMDVLFITYYETVGGGLSPDLPNGLTAIGV